MHRLLREPGNRRELALNVGSLRCRSLSGVGGRPASFASMARLRDGDTARSRMAGPNFRRNRIGAASQAS
jgi:hypothetical protein